MPSNFSIDCCIAVMLLLNRRLLTLLRSSSLSFFVVFLIFSAELVSAFDYHQLPVAAAAAKRSERYCGKRLVTTLKRLCNDCYKEKSQTISSSNSHLARLGRGKRNSGFLLGGTTVDELVQESGTILSSSAQQPFYKLFAITPQIWWQFEHKSREIRKRTSDRNIGVATRCCINSCTYSELINYCCVERALQLGAVLPTTDA